MSGLERRVSEQFDDEFVAGVSRVIGMLAERPALSAADAQCALLLMLLDEVRALRAEVRRLGGGLIPVLITQGADESGTGLPPSP